MRAWIGSRIDDSTTFVYVIDRTPRPSVEEVVAVLGELSHLSGEPTDAVGDLAVLDRKRDLLERIEAAERTDDVRSLHPAPGQHFDWAGPDRGGFELARAVLTDAVGDPPPSEIVDRYVADVIVRLPHHRFRIDASDVHEWLVRQELFVEAELVAHRGRMDPDCEPALRIASPDGVPDTNDPRGNAAIPDPATASALVAACEQAWAEIQRHHPDVPHAVVVLGSGVDRGRLVKLGHWWGGRWLADNEIRGEVLLAGEALHLPAEQVFEVLLHEAAHGLNAAHDVKDTSRGGRYHNKRFRMTAELVGLDVSAMPPYGWARTELTPETIERYRDAIDSLGDAMRIARRVDHPQLDRDGAEVNGDPETGGPQTGRGTETASSDTTRCGCGRRMRMAPSILAAGPVICGLCGNEFQTGRSISRVSEPRVETHRADPNVDETFLTRRREALAAERSTTITHPQTHLPAFLAAAREAGVTAHPAVVALAHHHHLSTAPADSAPALRSPELTATQRAGLVEIVMAGDKPGDWAVASWYQALGSAQERPMAAGSPAEAARRRDLARAMLKAEGTLHGPPIEVAGREFLAGDRILVGPKGIASLELDPGIPGSIERVDPNGTWLEVDFPTGGHYRLDVNSAEATALTHGYAQVVPGVEHLDLRTLHLHPPHEVQPVPSMSLPEIDL